MIFRPAVPADLPRIEVAYRAIIERMDANNIRIWDDVYPCAFFADDVERGRLHVLMDGDEMAAAFALCPSNDGASAMDWKDADAPALYLDRLGVNVGYARRGLGGAMLRHACRLARERGARYLRLFVVDCNAPALNLYRKNGFQQVPGAYDEAIDEALVLRMLGFEKETAR